MQKKKKLADTLLITITPPIKKNSHIVDKIDINDNKGKYFYILSEKLYFFKFF